MLTIVPVSIRDAFAFVAKLHRHHKPPQGAKFAIGVEAAYVPGRLVGVVVVARPVARMLDNGRTAEVTRCCTDGTPDACSALYGAAWRTAREMGYRKCITYTLAAEGGASLRGAGWRRVAEKCGGGSWSRASRGRIDKAPLEPKVRWEIGQ